jgi:hypothetical protein
VRICFRILSLETKDASASSWMFDFVSYFLARYKNENEIKNLFIIKLSTHVTSFGWRSKCSPRHSDVAHRKEESKNHARCFLQWKVHGSDGDTVPSVTLILDTMARHAFCSSVLA